MPRYLDYLFFGRKVKKLLLKAEANLPFDTPEENLKIHPNEYSKKVFHEFIAEGEWGIASNILIHILEENNVYSNINDEFWNPFYKAQVMMKRMNGELFCLKHRAK